MQKPQVLIVTVSSTSKTVAELLEAAGLTLPEWTSEVLLRPHGTGIYMNSGTSSASYDPMGLVPITIPCTPESISDLEFYAASNTKMTILATGV